MAIERTRWQLCIVSLIFHRVPIKLPLYSIIYIQLYAALKFDNIGYVIQVIDVARANQMIKSKITNADGLMQMLRFLITVSFMFHYIYDDYAMHKN